MINSMTGFGRYEVSDENRKITVEMKSVNHRYLDVNMKMPKKLNFFDSAIRVLLKKYVSRGKFDIFISYEDTSENTVSLKYNKELAGEYLNYIEDIEKSFGLPGEVTALSLAKMPDVISMQEQNVDEEELWKLLEKAISGACENMLESRKNEGENLKNDLLGKLDVMLEKVDFIEERYPSLLDEYRTRLTDKVTELLGSEKVDDARIATEIVIYADKICVDEEVVRLKSHILKMKSDLIAGGDVGRKLDFIAQEMNREANTILSKTSDIEITNVGVDLKTEIEKVREQIQNIE